MQKRIRVAGIVKRGDEILIAKRVHGRSEEPVFWEIPTGKIAFGEQPEEAIVRLMRNCLGVETRRVVLKDAVSFVAPEGSSQLDNLYIVYDIEVVPDDPFDPAERYSAYKFIRVERLAEMRLNAASAAVIEIEEGGNRGENESFRGAANGATVYVDGASRGNPGAAAIGYYIVGEDGAVLSRGGKFIGFASSRVSEYYALREGVRRALEMGLKSVKFVSDSMMVVNQMNGVYKIKNNDVLPIYREIQEMLSGFEACAFIHKNREFNKEADFEANRALERHFDESVI